jgi:uncharacterized membrane protein
MKSVLEFVRTTVVGGLLVVLPIVLLVLVLMETVDLIGAVVEPIAAALPFVEVAGVEVGLLVAIAIILFVCFLTGLIAKTSIGAGISRFFEKTFLDRVLGYKLIKGLTQSFARVTEQSQFSVAAVDLYGDGTRVLGFIVDEVDGGDFAIFVPSSPMQSRSISAARLDRHRNQAGLGPSLRIPISRGRLSSGGFVSESGGGCRESGTLWCGGV